MAALAVIEDFDVFRDCQFRVSPRRILLMVDQFILQATPEAFHGRVIVAVTLARHGCLHAELREQLAVVVSTILAAAVRVENQAWRWPFVAHRSPQPLRRQFLRHPGPSA